ncbi:DUF134 domain-containing protein [Puniceicoccus vermicola]|uniref:UPF0251 protein H5P30_00490 n=1 Tax=Puniceicoccus vermicola TaxID=388746 RepID=A0A7X1AUN3_9BACT|nr:DUF134 domain-containing protein [Puniceicoccus vermicola]MBC2600252.1 DUF134 domain-containing protein [Puniceicoccus vermicola]
MRPSKCRFVEFHPEVRLFKPQGIPAAGLSTIELQADELEALRLVDHEGLHHSQAGQRMGVSRATLGRILERARAKVADALLHGHALAIQRK